MHRPRTRLIALSALLVLSASIGIASATPGSPGPKRNVYFTVTDVAGADTIADGGYDVASTETLDDGSIRLELVLLPQERNSLRKQGFDLDLVRVKGGQTVAQFAAAQAVGGFEVYRPYDGPGGIRDQLFQIARTNRNIARLYVIGHTHEGREIIAMRLTQGAGDVPVGSRPAVLYQGTTHAREWISTEVTMRLLRTYLAGFPKNKSIHNILKTTELWFVPVVNPDGYQYSFEGDRLWRKNLRDNDGDGVVTNNDGVDLNRNYPEHWNYDDEGSSTQLSSQTYRGPAPASEPETQASLALFDMVPFRFAISYHSFGELLLYTQGWQVQTPSADDAIFVALSGTDTNPAIPGYDPGVGADLYTTNGEFTDWAHAEEGALAWTPELAEGCAGCGFVFPDDEALVQAEFERNLPFALNVAKSAADPDDPASHAGIDTKSFYLDMTEIDPWKANNPSSDLDVDLSYAGGSGQTVEVLAKRSVGPVTLHYRISSGGVEITGTAPTAEAPAGEVYGGNNAYDVYYHYLRGTIPDLAVGDTVEYWFTGGGDSSSHATFDVVEDADADVLILAAEDRTGASRINPDPSTSAGSPNYVADYADAITAAGYTHDVYDVDAMGRQAPDHLGVLSHYDAVVWYTGNDFVTREPGWSAGNASRLANDLMLEVRAYLNEGGKLLHTGQLAGGQFSGAAGTQMYDPVANERCIVAGMVVVSRCQVLSDKDDFFQYYLGAYLYNFDAGFDPDTGNLYDATGVGAPFLGSSSTFNGVESAQNQATAASFLSTSSLLPEAEYPQFASDAPIAWDTGASGVFEPHTGSQYVYSQRSDITYKRLTKTIDLTTAGAAELAFFTSYDTESHWDHLFVEAHTVGQDDWTTLPDSNGHTSQDTGDSCPEGWIEDLHPHLAHYQTLNEDGTCSPTGTTGSWHAASGRSSGWEEWSVDLSPFAGKQVEVSIAYVSDWGVQGLGVFLDDVAVTTGSATDSTSFESDLGGWTVSGPPAGSDANPNDWVRTPSVGFEEGAAISTDDTLYFGFGIEGVTGAANRADLMQRSLNYLIP